MTMIVIAPITLVGDGRIMMTMTTMMTMTVTIITTADTIQEAITDIPLATAIAKFCTDVCQDMTLRACLRASRKSWLVVGRFRLDKPRSCGVCRIPAQYVFRDFRAM